MNNTINYISCIEAVRNAKKIDEKSEKKVDGNEKSGFFRRFNECIISVAGTGEKEKIIHFGYAF